MAGFTNTIGRFNTFIGKSADFDGSPTSDDYNTLLGALTKVTSGFSNATAIGAFAQVSQSNSLVLGSINGVNFCDSNSNCDSVKVGIGATAPGAILDVQRDGSAIPQTALFTTYGANNEILGRASDGTRVMPMATLNGTTLFSLLAPPGTTAMASSLLRVRAS